MAGYKLIKENGILTTNMIVEIQQIVKQNNAGIRKQVGTVLKNDKTGEVIYMPPGNEKTIRNLMKNLEDYINEKSNVDPLIKMAVAHYQFEAIHPFYDGNGRTGRIINILHLVMNNLLDSPILYLSKYILNNRSEYYKTLQNITENNDWESWIIYVLKGIQKTSKDSIQLLKKINSLINKRIFTNPEDSSIFLSRNPIGSHLTPDSFADSAKHTAFNKNTMIKKLI